MNQTLTRERPARGLPGTGPAAVREMVLPDPGITSQRRRRAGRPARDVARPRALWASCRPQVAAWRARNWRRVVLAWFILCLVVVAVAAEPATAFPRAQVSSMPAGPMALRVVGGLTAAGIPVVLIVLP